jgi:hypothetical protein
MRTGGLLQQLSELSQFDPASHAGGVVAGGAGHLARVGLAVVVQHLFCGQARFARAGGAFVPYGNFELVHTYLLSSRIKKARTQLGVMS